MSEQRTPDSGESIAPREWVLWVCEANAMHVRIEHGDGLCHVCFIELQQQGRASERRVPLQAVPVREIIETPAERGERENMAGEYE